MIESNKKLEELQVDNHRLRLQLEEATEMIEAIRTGQIDALIIRGEKGHELYTLKTADQSYRVFIEKMIEGAVTLNQKQVIIYCNSRFANMVQMPLSHVIGLPFSTFIRQDDIQLFDACFRRGFGEDCKEEIWLMGKEKATPCQLSLTTLDLDSGTSLSIIVTDLSAQKAAQKELKDKNDQLERINKALELSNIDLQQFAYVASHDLQEPLRKITLFSSMLNMEADASKDRQYIEKIIASSKRMKTLISDVLDYAKISAYENYFEETDLNQLIEDLLVDFEIRINEKNATISIDPLPKVEVVPSQVRQVFHNLISNALKFSKEGEPCRVNISVKRIKEKNFESAEDQEGAYCCISIKDNGVGFGQNFSAHVFTLFQRLHSKDKYEGTGIGLAISKKIVEKHNGMITVKSNVGDGAEFLIILPIKQLQPA